MKDRGELVRVTAACDLGLGARLAGLAAVGDSVPAAEVDRAARSAIEAAGRGKPFTHSTGHGVVLCLHETPGSRGGPAARGSRTSWS